MKKNRKMVQVLCSVVLSLLLCFPLVACESEPDVPEKNLATEVVEEDAEEVAEIAEGDTKEDTESTEVDTDGPGEFQMTVLDVGQGLSVLVEADGHAMIYDGGGRSASSYVVSYLKHQGITDLDYMFASHYDEDHINGLVGLLNTTAVRQVITPDYETDTKIYKSFRDKLEQNGADEEHPKPGDCYALGDATIQVLSPQSYENRADNDASIAVRIQYGSFHCVITGDAEYEAEQEMLASGYELDADVYVVGHHGSKSSSSREFVEAMSPEYALISVGADNSYGHPAQETLELLEEEGIGVLRTDLQQELVVRADGQTYWLEQQALEQQLSDQESQEQQLSIQETECTYVLNLNKKKFHKPDCKSVDDMKEKNKKYSNESREAIMEQGFEPCGNCHP